MGLIEWEDVHPNWLPYVLIDDLEALLERTREAGGHVMLEPVERFERGRVALIMDPTDGVLAVFQRGEE